MNKKDLLDKLIKKITQYKSYNFYFNDDFLKEFAEIVSKVSYQDTFLSQLTTLLCNVHDYTYNIYQIDSHEHLKGTPFYSLHMQCKNYNIRLIVLFKDNNPVFLRAFYERAGKGKTDYSSQITIAEKRLEQLGG